MEEAHCSLGSGILPLHDTRHYVEEDCAFDGKARVGWGVDGEPVADSGATVVPGKNERVGLVVLGE